MPVSAVLAGHLPSGRDREACHIGGATQTAGIGRFHFACWLFVAEIPTTTFAGLDELLGTSATSSFGGAATLKRSVPSVLCV